MKTLLRYAVMGVVAFGVAIIWFQVNEKVGPGTECHRIAESVISCTDNGKTELHNG